MPTTRRIAVLAAAALLAVGAAPAVAPAQNGAGDEQYQDPFAGSGSGSSGSGSSSGSSGSAQPSGGGSSTSPSSSGSAPPATTTPATASAGRAAAPAAPGTAAAQLPRTGLDLRLVAGAGALLLLAGLLLRRRTGDGRS